MIRNVLLLSALPLAAGCRIGGFLVEPSELELTREMRGYIDGLEPTKEVLELEAIPYVARGAATNRNVRKFRWWLFILDGQGLGRLDPGYGYKLQTVVLPAFQWDRSFRYDEDGQKTAERRAAYIGLLARSPYLRIVGCASERTLDVQRNASHRDFDLYVLYVGGLETSLLSVGTTGFDFLFIPLWRKDRSPP